MFVRNDVVAGNPLEIFVRFVDKMMDAMPAEELAEELVGVIHRTMDSERRERHRKEIERDFDSNDEALLERYYISATFRISCCTSY